MYSNTFTLTLICLSEKDLVNMTLNKSSVGKVIPKLVKLSSLDFRSISLILAFFIGFIEFTKIY